MGYGYGGPKDVVLHATDGSNAQAVRADPITRALIGISYAHHETHEGSSFKAAFADVSMADTDSFNVAFKTPAGDTRAHMLFTFETLVGGTLQIYEGATWDGETGAAVPILNRNRKAPGSSILLEDQNQAAFTASDELISNVTNVGLGSAVAFPIIHAFGAQSRSAGLRRDENEWPLAADTAYLVVFTAVGANNKGAVELGWYEHTDK